MELRSMSTTIHFPLSLCFICFTSLNVSLVLHYVKLPMVATPVKTLCSFHVAVDSIKRGTFLMIYASIWVYQPPSVVDRGIEVVKVLIIMVAYFRLDLNDLNFVIDTSLITYIFYRHLKIHK